MAKITRQTFKQFAVNVNAASDICEFGTPATGSPVYTSTISTLQANSAWTTGWAAETVANNRPFLEDMNATHYVFAYMLAYIFEMGIPEYDAGTTYFINSVVQYGGTCYQSLQDNNLANTPTVGAYWQLLIPVTTFFTTQNVVTGSRAYTTVYQNTTGKPLFVSVCGYSLTTNASLALYVDTASSPANNIFATQAYGPSGDGQAVAGMVPNNYYYKVTLGGSSPNLSIWVETN